MAKGKMRVLLVDDDADFRAATRSILEAAGYGVLEAPNGAQGFALARDQAPDLVVVDVVMDTYSEGFDLIRRLATDARTLGIPRILLSTLRLMEEMDPVHPVEMGTSNVLQKPVEPRVLVAAIERAVGAGPRGPEEPEGRGE